MPKVARWSDEVRPYVFHGVDLVEPAGSSQAHGRCPFCDKERKFFINKSTGQWDCKVCGERGNLHTFLGLLHKQSEKATALTDLQELADDRKVLATTLRRWRVARSLITGDWVVPGWSYEGKLVQLYCYRAKGGRKVLLATPSLKHGLLQPSPPLRPAGHEGPGPGVSNVYVTEGPWDGMALEEAMERARAAAGGLVLTGARDASLLGAGAVVAVPGCNVFRDAWRPLFAARRTVLLYDNDHPKEANGQLHAPGAEAGLKQAVEVLSNCSLDQRPSDVMVLAWGAGDTRRAGLFDPSRPHGHDLRDELRAGGAAPGSAEERAALGRLLGLLAPPPPAWGAGAPPVSKTPELTPLPCNTWKTLVNEWRKAMRWTEGLNVSLAVSLACATSTMVEGDQLWVKIIGPASCGKSTLCEALSVARKYVYPKDTISGLFSGYQTDKEGSEDLSLGPQIRGKTLAIKDADTILQMPNLGQILSQFRALYDRAFRTQYRNKMSRDHENIDSTVIFYGTSSMRLLDSSELGERFLDCVLMEDIDEELEAEINWRSGNKMRLIMARGGRAGGEDVNAALVHAKRLTGGYVEHLRGGVHELLAQVALEDAALEEIIRYGTFVAYMRARPSTKQEEEVQREMSTRLVNQLTKLAYCLALVFNKKNVEEEVLAVVRKVALDTARGRTFKICQQLHRYGTHGAEAKTIALCTGESEEKERVLLRFLRKIGATELFSPPGQVPGLSTKPRWRMTPRLTRLYTAAVLASPSPPLKGGAGEEAEVVPHTANGQGAGDPYDPALYEEQE